MTLPFLTSPILSAVAGVRHGFFTRRGGVSTGIYASLNLGRGSDDDQAHVAENYAKVAAAFGVEARAVNTCWQIHSARVVVARQAVAECRPEADGVIAGQPGLVCGALSADCAPVLIADPAARVVGAVHAGWRGALDGVIQAAVDAMVALGGDPGRMVAAVGPCIGPASYEVGMEFLETFTAHDPAWAGFFDMAGSPDKRLFNLPGFVLGQLAKAGVAHREWIGRDTCAEADEFYSNRRAFKRGESDYGRLISAIMLEP